MDHKKNDRPPRTGDAQPIPVHPAWVALIRHCREMGHGEIERVKIQDGIPVMIERSVQRVKLT